MIGITWRVAFVFATLLLSTAVVYPQGVGALEKYLELDPKARDPEQIRCTIKELRSKP